MKLVRISYAVCCSSLSASVCIAQTDVAESSTIDSDKNVTVLAPVRIEGQLLQESLPPGTTITTRSELQKRDVNSWADVGDRIDPAVSFNRRSNSIAIRGMDADRVVTRVDGIRIPWLNDGARGVQGGLDSVNFNTLSRLDVVRAGGAVRSGALTGSIELHTLTPDDLLTPGQDYGALIKADYDGEDRSRGLDAAFAGRLGTDTRWLLQLGQRRGHELSNYGGRGGYGPDRVAANPENYRQNNALLKIEHAVGAQHTFSLSGERFRRNTVMDDRRDQGPGQSFAVGNNETLRRIDRDRVVLGYDFRSAAMSAPVDRGSVKAYWQRSRLANEQDAWRQRDERGAIIPGDPFKYAYPYGPYYRDNQVQESGFGMITEWGGVFHQASLTHRWSAGGEWYGSRVLQQSAGYDNCPGPTPHLPEPFGPRACDFLHTDQADTPRVKGNAWSLWAQDEVSWADGRYAVIPALRFDAYRYRPDQSGAYEQNPNAHVSDLANNSGQRLSPSLMARYTSDANWSAYVKYGYGYRAPNASELYLTYGAPGTYLNVGNPELKPEVSRGIEVGLEAGDRELGGRISIFHNRYSNFIEQQFALQPGAPEWNPAWDGVYPMGVSGTINRGRVRIYGLELAGHWRITSNWYTRASLAWAQGRDLDTRRYLNSVAPLKAQLALGYETPAWGAEAGWTVAARRTKVEYPESEGDVPADFQAPGYGLANFTAWWTPAAIKGLRVQAGIYNVFDKKYWNALDVPRPSGRGAAPVDSFTQTGRALRASISYQY